MLMFAHNGLCNYLERHSSSRERDQLLKFKRGISPGSLFT